MNRRDGRDQRVGETDRGGSSEGGQSDDRTEDRPDEGYANVTLPGQNPTDEGEPGSSTEADEVPVPPQVRKPLLRDRVRERLGLGYRQWYVVESVLLVLPYPIFVLIYFTFDVNETLFLVFTGLYSLVAMYVGFLS